MKTKWKMEQSEWERYKKENDERIYNSYNCYGSFECGALRFEFAHTMDDTAWYPYINVFVYGIDDGYGNLKDGTPYTLDDVWTTPLEADTFEQFKADCEELLKKQIAENPAYSDYIKMPFGAWN